MAIMGFHAFSNTTTPSSLIVVADTGQAFWIIREYVRAATLATSFHRLTARHAVACDRFADVLQSILKILPPLFLIPPAGRSLVRMAKRPTPNAGAWLCSSIQPFRIRVSQWVRTHIRVRIQTAIEPNRIALHVPAGLRVVISLVVVDSSSRREPSYTTAISPAPSSA